MVDTLITIAYTCMYNDDHIDDNDDDLSILVMFFPYFFCNTMFKFVFVYV